jgi:hypothetical protein
MVTRKRLGLHYFRLFILRFSFSFLITILSPSKAMRTTSFMFQPNSSIISIGIVIRKLCPLINFFLNSNEDNLRLYLHQPSKYCSTSHEQLRGRKTPMTEDCRTAAHVGVQFSVDTQVAYLCAGTVIYNYTI